MIVISEMKIPTRDYLNFAPPIYADQDHLYTITRDNKMIKYKISNNNLEHEYINTNPTNNIINSIKQNENDILKITGVYVKDNDMVFTISKWYNVAGLHYHSVIANNVSIKTTVHSNQTDGYICAVHPRWQKLLKNKVLFGSWRLQGTAHSTLGCSLFSEKETFLAPPIGKWQVDEIIQKTYMNTQNLKTLPDWNEEYQSSSISIGYTSQANGAIMTENRIYFSGWVGTGRGWYGLPEIEINGIKYRDLVSNSKGYHNENRKPCIWEVDPVQLVEVSQGLRKPHEVEVKENYINFNGSLYGMACDHNNGKIYCSGLLYGKQRETVIVEVS